VSVQDSPRRLLAKSKRSILAAFEQQSLPFEQIVETVNPPRDSSRSPLYQIMFNFLNQPKSLLQFPGCAVEALATENRTAKMDLTVAVEEHAESFSVAAEFRTDLFSEERIRRLLDHYAHFLAAFATQPDTVLADLDYWREVERQTVLEGYNATTRAWLTDEMLHHNFFQQARLSPDAPAFSHGVQTLNYGELAQHADHLARYLHAEGIGPETVVAIIVQRSLAYPIAVFGILQAGAAFLPLDPELPNERLAYMLTNADVHCVVTQPLLSKSLPALNVPVLLLENPAELPSLPPVPVMNSHPAQLAYLIYTSGSTGKPKGVQIQHGGAVNLLYAMAETLGLSSEDTLLAVAPFSFDMHIPDIFLPLALGMHVVILEREQGIDGAALNAVLADIGPAIMQATPTAWRLLLASGWQCPPHFRVITGGEALPADLAARLLETGAVVWNFYGPTETTVWSSCYRVSSSETAIPVGPPLANTQLYVLDTALRPVPLGVPGELYIGGVGLARGYRNNPAQTAERFVPNPFAHEAGARLYRTGDRARYRFDGALEVLGRFDEQIKLRGHRIELGEIESLLKQYPGVADAVAIVREDHSGEAALVAYWVTDSTATAPTRKALQQYLSEQLPRYMLPSVLLELPALPRNANGKLDRKALPAPTADTQAYNLALPRTALEASMLELWREVLQTQAFSVTDNFFSHGGHSLLALHLVEAIKQRFAQSVSLAAFMQAPTVEAICQQLTHVAVAYSPLVRLSPQGLTPFFFIPGASGNPFSYLPLAQHLSPAATVYALQPDGIASIAQLASDYRVALREVQPHGPYRLGGHSFGALVAFELALQLRQEDEAVALLALIDQAVPDSQAKPLERTSEQWLADIAEAAARFTSKPLPETSVFSKAEFLRYLIDIGMIPAHSSVELVDLILARYQSSQQAIDCYQPSGSLDCPIRVFRSDEAAALPQGLGWAAHSTGDIADLAVPGDHITVVAEPHVAVLGARLCECLTDSTLLPRAL
jgi:amino acid adenylation domain-containing protein